MKPQYEQFPLSIYNTLGRQKQKFEPIHKDFVGLYACGPTVYSDVHLGNCRTFINFDVIYRYLLFIGYKVRYVRNITDAGHMVGDGDGGEDKIAKKARLEQLEPMEVVHRYTTGFHKVMQEFNILPPSIEPTATGHIIEQIEMVCQILEKGFAYEVDGNVYFDVEKYRKDNKYTELSGWNLDELMTNSRDLSGQDSKKSPLDFALWMKANDSTLQKWPSPWSEGYPGWHLECSAMSTKYLGERFDIHGGGLDLVPTHHTNEIAQGVACNGCSPCNFWMHTNMLTVNGQKMSKSLNNSFLPQELFDGSHELLERGYGPMAVRFFILQTHYSSTLDFSNDALQAAEKGYKKLMQAQKILNAFDFSQFKGKGDSEADNKLQKHMDDCFLHMSDDFNTPRTLASLFEISSTINNIKDGRIKMEEISSVTGDRLKQVFNGFIVEVLGLLPEDAEGSGNNLLESTVKMLIDIRSQAKGEKNFGLADQIRDQLKEAGITLQDGKEGTGFVID